MFCVTLQHIRYAYVIHKASPTIFKNQTIRRGDNRYIPETVLCKILDTYRSCPDTSVASVKPYCIHYQVPRGRNISISQDIL